MSLRTIRLYGHLGERFGRVFRLDVQSPSEAVRALCIQLPGFRQAVVSHPGAAGGYRVSAGNDKRTANTLGIPCGERESIRIVPVLCGAGKNGGVMTIIGAIVVVVGAYFGQTWAVGLGMSMMAGGIAQMLAKSPVAAAPPDKPENKASFAFDGAVNTIAQGNPVPICYGRMIVGSQVISAGMSVEQI